jgi:hypothetical protein
MSGLARSFRDHFVRRFDQSCGDSAANARECWLDTTRWTNFMLHSDNGVMSRAASDWAEENIGSGKYAVRREWRKFDLMVLSPAIGPAGDWWRSTPRLTLEHENDDDTHVEVWNLACWQSPLKVLVTYHRANAVLERKLQVASDVLQSHASEVGPSNAEFLIMSAPRAFSEMKWSSFEWSGSSWSKML